MNEPERWTDRLKENWKLWVLAGLAYLGYLAMAAMQAPGLPVLIGLAMLPALRLFPELAGMMVGVGFGSGWFLGRLYPHVPLEVGVGCILVAQLLTLAAGRTERWWWLISLAVGYVGGIWWEVSR